jgi:hypothetical protein
MTFTRPLSLRVKPHMPLVPHAPQVRIGEASENERGGGKGGKGRTNGRMRNSVSWYRARQLVNSPRYLEGDGC